MLTPTLKTLTPKKLLGINLTMSLANNKTGQLWKQFGPQIKNISNSVSTATISMQVYDADYYKNFSPVKEFTKWAAVEVENFDEIPVGLSSFVLEGGLYAVFDYKGSSADPSIFHYIFQEWLPKSDYVIDNRPHFEVLGEKYANNDVESEEEIWIPIVKRG